MPRKPEQFSYLCTYLTKHDMQTQAPPGHALNNTRTVCAILFCPVRCYTFPHCIKLHNLKRCERQAKNEVFFRIITSVGLQKYQGLPQSWHVLDRVAEQLLLR